MVCRAGWSVSLLEVHTMHAVRDSTTGEDTIVRREYHCITDHKDHSWNATQVFFQKVHADMMTHGEFTVRREMTDGANDFKSKTPLASVGLSWLLNGFARENNQTLPGKGKGECDRTGGHFGAFVKLVMKLVDDTQVTGLERPTCALDLCRLMRTQTSFLRPVLRPGLTVYKLMIYAAEEDFPDPQDLIQGLTTLDGSRSHFCYATPLENKDIDMAWALYRGKGSVDILYRRLTCGCDRCCARDYDQCLRKSTVGVMKR